jgi:hypothetical protein
LAISFIMVEAQQHHWTSAYRYRSNRNPVS